MNGRGQWERDYGAQIEGEALMHYVDGWTAMSFWDRTIDKRSGCNSTFIARGRFVFDELLAMARAQYPKRFSLMKFKIVEVKK